MPLNVFVLGIVSVLARRRIPVRCGKWRSGAGRHSAAALFESQPRYQLPILA